MFQSGRAKWKEVQLQINKLAFLALLIAAPEAKAVTVDFTGAAAGQNQQISQTYGDTSLVNFTYHTLLGGNNWGLTAAQGPSLPVYWANTTPSYSGDNAIYALANRKLEIRMDAAPGYMLSGVKFHLGSFQNTDRDIAYRFYDGLGELLQSNPNSNVPGVGLIIAPNLAAPSYIFQMGDSRFVGVQSIDYTVTPLPSAVPVPPALPLLATALGSFGLLRRKKLQQS